MMKLKLIHIVLLFVFGVNLLVAFTPLNHTVFDECYYVPAARDMLSGVASNIEHPPLAKLFMGVSIAVFGDGWLAWRLPSILFSVVAVWFVYKIALRFLSEKLALFSAVLMSCSTIFLLVGSAGILDMPMLALSLAAVYYGLHSRFVVSGLLFGAALLCKELAALVLVAFLIYLLSEKVSVKKLVLLVGLASALFIGGLWVYDLTYLPVVGGYTVSDPVNHAWIIIKYQLRLNAIRAPGEAAFYPPVSWVSPFGPNSFNPLAWYWAVYGSRLLVQWAAQPNMLVEYFMFPLLAALPYFVWKRQGSLAKFVWLWLAVTFLPWLLASVVVRMEANFYVVYSVPALALGVAYLYSLVKCKKLRYMLALVHLVLAGFVYLYYFPYLLFR